MDTKPLSKRNSPLDPHEEYRMLTPVKVKHLSYLLGIYSVHALICFRKFCSKSGIPIAEHETAGPSQCLEFLQFKIRTVFLSQYV